jgi:hypothetical protein
MAGPGWGNPPRTSTQAEATNPTTSVLLAEIQDLGGPTNGNGVLYDARVLVGASTLATVWLEQCLSSGLGSTALRSTTAELGRRVLYVQVNQTAQYLVRFRATSGDRLRVRLGGGITGTAAATLQVEAVI